jgi:hypothetical protein
MADATLRATIRDLLRAGCEPLKIPVRIADEMRVPPEERPEFYRAVMQGALEALIAETPGEKCGWCAHPVLWHSQGPPGWTCERPAETVGLTKKGGVVVRAAVVEGSNPRRRVRACACKADPKTKPEG